MKKAFLFFIAAIVMTSSVVVASEKPVATSNVAVMKLGSVFKLFYKSNTINDVKVSIHDASNKVVFEETIKRVDGFVRPYNFASLAEGDYTIEVVDKINKQVQKVSYKEGRVQTLFNVMRVAGAEDKYLLTISNKQEDVLSIKIFDANRQLLYSQTENVKGEFAKVYNLQKVNSKLVFEIKDSKGNTKSFNY